jgi:hypothetical protein
VTGLASSAFARHYSRNHYCFLFQRVLRCFTSPRSPLHPMYSGTGDTTQLVPGFPIRTSWDHSSVDNSPRPIAASHVLHRLLVPRHPPSALGNLTKRCSRPLCNSQPTTHPTTPAHTTRRPSPTNPRTPGNQQNHTNAVCVPAAGRHPKTQPRNPHGSCFLRTQQGVHAHPPTHPDHIPTTPGHPAVPRTRLY